MEQELTNGERIVIDHLRREIAELKAQNAAKDEQLKAKDVAGAKELRKQNLLHRLEIEQGDDLTPLALQFLSESAQIDDEGQIIYQNHKAKSASELANKLKADEGLAGAFFKSMSEVAREQRRLEALKAQGLPDPRKLSTEDLVNLGGRLAGLK